MDLLDPRGNQGEGQNASQDGRSREDGAGKRGALFGGAAEEAALASSPAVLRRSRGGSSLVGLQQWFTPLPAARLIAGVFGPVTGVLDPTAGAGDLLCAFDERVRYGIEIDRDHIPKAKKGRQQAPEASDNGGAGTYYRAAHGDAQRVVPMLRAAGLRWPAVAANPPFGLTWRDAAHVKGSVNSTLLTFLWALDLLAPYGQGAMILGRHRLAREVLPHERASGIYAVVDVDGPLFEGVALPCSIAFFVQPQNRQGAGYPLRLHAPVTDLPDLSGEVLAARSRASHYVSLHGQQYATAGSLSEAFSQVAREAARRAGEREGERARKRGRYDAALNGSRISISLSGFAQLALARKGSNRAVELLHGHSASYFGQNPKALKQLEELADGGLLTVDPALTTRARRAIEEAVKVSTPLMPLRPQMRLGWLTDLESIRCKTSDPARGFVAGESYRLKTSSVVHQETDRRVVETKTGEHELRKFTTERRLLRVQIGEHDEAGGRVHTFDEGPESIGYLADHFELPDPGCVATRHPEEVERNRRVLLEIERDFGFEEKGKKIKPFQLDHLSRLLTKKRGLLAHDPGLGKTLQQMLIAEAMHRLGHASPQALFVFPQDLMVQWSLEAKAFFGRDLIEISTPQKARQVAEYIEAHPEEPGWYCTYYEALSIVGRKKVLLPETPLDPREALQDRLAAYKRKKRASPVTSPEASEARASEPKAGEAKAAEVEAGEPPRLTAPGPTTRYACPKCGADTDAGWNGEVCSSRDGETGKHCGYVHRAVYVKTAASHLTRAFRRGVKCVDEVAEMRGDDSLRSKALRALAKGTKKGGGAHNFGGSGTPISNYVADIYWILWWSLGNASVAFPYDYAGGKARFEHDYCTVEYLHGRQKDGEEHLKKRRKILPRITNVSQFWRLTQPSVSRCRKDQTGEHLVEKTYHPIRVPLGVGQRDQVEFWLSEFKNYFSWRNPDHPFVREGLVEKFQAALGMGWRLEAAATLPAWDEPTREWPKAREKLGEPSNWTPATLKTLEIALKHVARGEKVLIGSDLLATGKFLAERLNDKGVKAVHITEERAGKTATKTPRKRSGEVRAFAEGEAQVLCAGLQAVKLGHNLTSASAVIVNGLDWSHMVLVQFLDRVHRLTSEKPVNVYVIIPKGTIAERKWALLRDKGGAADLALDGELFVQPEKPVDLNKILEEMKQKGIAPTGEEVPEAEVEAAWRKIQPLRLPPAKASPAAPTPLPPGKKPAGAPCTYRPASLFDLFDDETEGRAGPYVQPALFEAS